MTICFQADADLNEAVVSAVLRREPTIDSATATEARLLGLDDPDVLAIAAAAGRILVSHDARTMPLHFGEFILEHTSPGLLIVPSTWRSATRSTISSSSGLRQNRPSG